MSDVESKFIDAIKKHAKALAASGEEGWKARLDAGKLEQAIEESPELKELKKHIVIDQTP